MELHVLVGLGNPVSIKLGELLSIMSSLRMNTMEQVHHVPLEDLKKRKQGVGAPTTTAAVEVLGQGREHELLDVLLAQPVPTDYINRGMVVGGLRGWNPTPLQAHC